ncbi:MAG: DUF333 domain-containing protein [Candidatus Altiarchaeota archaeon]
MRMNALALLVLAVLLCGCISNPRKLTTTTTEPVASTLAIANPASEKCLRDGGELKIASTGDGERGICFFPDASVCDEWEYFRGECQEGKCMMKCDKIGTRSEGWYDCNDRLLYWDNCGTPTFEEEAVEDENFLNCSTYNASEACTMEYNPVCGLVQAAGNTEWKSYSNPCSACALSGEAVLGYREGDCSELNL